MTKSIVQKSAKLLLALAALTFAATVSGAPAKETMCVKQKDGSYKCKASGKIMKEPCCDTPRNDVKTPKPRK